MPARSRASPTARWSAGQQLQETLVRCPPHHDDLRDAEAGIHRARLETTASRVAMAAATGRGHIASSMHTRPVVRLQTTAQYPNQRRFTGTVGR